jgi:hypothetical protein
MINEHRFIDKYTYIVIGTHKLYPQTLKDMRFAPPVLMGLTPIRNSD